MATTIDITCPECGKSSKGPAELQGKTIKCKQCQAVFRVPAAVAVKAVRPPVKPVVKPVKAEAVTAIPIKNDEDEEDQQGPSRNPYGVTEENLAARCPFCALPLDPPDAKVCVHCGYDMVRRKRLESKQTHEITAGDYFMYHLATILCFFGICLLLGFDVFALLNASDWMKESWFDNGDGTYMIKPGIIPLYVFLASLAGIVPMARIMIKRLIHFTPPEIQVRQEE